MPALQGPLMQRMALDAVRRGLRGVHVILVAEPHRIFEARGVDDDGLVLIRHLNGEDAGRVPAHTLRALHRTYPKPEED